MRQPPDPCARSFLFERDTFAFAHELVWQYRFDPATGEMTTFRTNPPPTYFHRCFVMVRSARQFFYHARFEPRLLAVEAQAYRKLIREIVSRSPRQASAESERVAVPGYDGLRSFSQAHGPLLKEECGGPWQSYFVRSHWRMVFPVWARHQERMAQRLAQSLREGGTPVVHLFCFPHVTINHGIVLFGATASEQVIQFEAYDPNIPDHAVQLAYERARRTFSFPPTHYWAGGPVSVNEVYRGGLY
jgi:hypothetical protein